MLSVAAAIPQAFRALKSDAKLRNDRPADELRCWRGDAGSERTASAW